MFVIGVTVSVHFIHSNQDRIQYQLLSINYSLDAKVNSRRSDIFVFYWKKQKYDASSARSGVSNCPCHAHKLHVLLASTDVHIQGESLTMLQSEVSYDRKMSF